MREPLREPMTESSLADGWEEASDEVVEDAEADCVWVCLPWPMAPCEVDGAETVRVLSCRRLGVD